MFKEILGKINPFNLLSSNSDIKDGIQTERQFSPSDKLDFFFHDFNNFALTQAGVLIGPENALGLSAYWAATRSISEDIAKLPFKLFEQMQPRGKEPLSNHVVSALMNNSFNENLSSIVGRQLIQAAALDWGNGYAEIQRDRSGNPIALHTIHSSRVTPKRMNGEIIYLIRKDDGQEIVIPARDMFHIRGLGKDELAGYSIAMIGRESLGLGKAQQVFASSFFGNGTNFGGIIEYPGKMEPEQIKTMRASFNRRYAGGPHKANQTAILENGMKWIKTTPDLKASDFVNNRKFSLEEVARWFRIPMHKLQNTDRATFSNIEELNLDYVTDTLTPWAVRWEQEIKRKLITAAAVRGQHQFQSLLRGNQLQRSQFYASLFNIGVLSINEIRDFENLNPIDEGDDHFVQLNLAPVGTEPQTNGTTAETETIVIEAGTKVLMPIIVSSAAVTIKNECNQIAKLANRDTYSAFKGGVYQYYEKLGSAIIDRFTSLIESAAAINSVNIDILLAELKVTIEKYVIESQAAVMYAHQTQDIADLLSNWRENKADILTARVYEVCSTDTDELQEGDYAKGPGGKLYKLIDGKLKSIDEALPESKESNTGTAAAC